MHRYLLATTAIAALAVPALPAVARDIATRVTNPVSTSTIADGAADAITITSAGSVVLGGGTAVTMDSNHAVTNQGAITVSGTANDTVGIRAVADTSGTITNSGTITVDEPYTATDIDNDGDLDGPFALGSNRFGIRTDGAHAGNVVNTGTIKVEGNDSAGIWLEGPLNGEVIHQGTTDVLGDRTVGVRTDDVTSNVRLEGTIAARGEGAIGAHLSGDVGGALLVQGTVTSTGYRNTTAPSNTANLDADDLLQGGSALVIEGNVAAGILLAASPPETPEQDRRNALVVSYGEAPAMVVGAADRDITVGAVPNTSPGFGLIINGTVAGNGVYAGIDGNGLVIGGQGGAVSIANGMSIAGTVSASSVDSNATALRLGSGANVPEVRISGTVRAAGGNASDALATAIRVDAGANAPTIHNSGKIEAVAAGTNGSATAIVDASGTVSLVSNSGAITASGGGADRNIAIDLRANTAGTTVRQTQVASGVAAPTITGDVYFGSGNDTFDVADGTVTGNARFGEGDNKLNLSGDAVHSGWAIFGAGADAMSLAGTSIFSGTADFGGGADTLTLADNSRFSGNLVNAGSLAVAVNGGMLDINRPASIGSLSVGENGVLIATLSKTEGEGSMYDIAGAASFAEGSVLAIRLADAHNAEGSYVILEAGSISGLDDLETNSELIPFMFKATFDEDAAPNTIAVDIARRTTAELGLNRSQSSAYGAIFSMLGEDEDIEEVFLGITDGEAFRSAVRRLLPDHAGGAFEGVSLGTRTFARQVADPGSPVYSLGGIDILFQGGGWTSEKGEGATASYDLDGFGVSTAAEIDTGLGAFGASLTWFWNEYDDGTNLARVLSDTYELAGYWRGKWGGFSAYGRGSIGLVDFNGRRTFRGMAGQDAVERNTQSEWSGTMYTFSAGASYEGGGRSFFFRPAVSVDYLSLSEDGYTDTGGEGLNLIVEDRKSDEFAVNGGLTLGIDFVGNGRGDSRWFRVETEGGWREIVGGSIGSTTARFGDGDSFTLEPEQVDSGWFARARAMAGSRIFEVGGEVGLEDRHDSTALSLRGTVRFGF